MRGARTVVGAAVVHDGRLLVAERGTGGWELPGGKVEPGEDEPTAARRELREELDLDVVVLGPLPGSVPVSPTLTLRAVVARPVDAAATERLRLTEHRQVRWVGPDDLGALDWLPADRPFVPVLRALLVHGARAHLVAGLEEEDDAREVLDALAADGVDARLWRAGFAGEDDSEDRPWMVGVDGSGPAALLRVLVEAREHAWVEDDATAPPPAAGPVPLPGAPQRLKRR